MNIPFATIQQLRQLLDSGSLSSQELLTHTLENYKKYDASVQSALELFSPEAILAATVENKKSPLNGIPGLIKDNICQKSQITSCASKILANYRAPYNATVINRLQDDGAYCIGRANCDEFAMGSSTETSAFQLTYNPWDTSRVPGGSSGGSIAAVAAGLVPFALGTETGGSVRQPAAFCGVVGFKPTYGLISRYGLIAYASSLDQVGITTRTVYDTAMVLSSLAGKDAHDSTTRVSWARHDYTAGLDKASCKGKRIAYIDNALNAKGMDPRVSELLHAALKKFEELGAEIVPVTLPTMEYSAAVYIVISRAEAASNFSRFDGVKYGYRTPEAENLESMYQKTRGEGFGSTVRQRIVIGNYVLSAGHAEQFYSKARAVQELMRREFFAALNNCDALFCPVTPAPAFKIGEILSNSLALDLQDYFTAAANLTGIPALALPCGFIDDLPMGFQLMGKEFDEHALFNLGHAYQEATDWHNCKPKGFE